MTHLSTYAQLSDGVKALLAELEEMRRLAWDQRRDASVASAIMAADYVIRTATCEVLADDDVKRCMELALEEVG